MTEKTAHDRLMDAISLWMGALDSYPGWREWNRRKIGKTIGFGEAEFGEPEPGPALGDFVFSDEVEAQHAVILGYLGLASTVHSLKDLEFYFRRYPFRGLPVSKHEHLSNVCEMYFSRFYEFRERAKNLLNAVNKVPGNGKINVGYFLKHFDKVYDSEIRERNSVHHRARFDDIQINKVWLTQVMHDADESRGWGREHRLTYRAASREWAARVRRRSASLEQTVEEIAAGILRCSEFLATQLKSTTQSEDAHSPPRS